MTDHNVRDLLERAAERIDVGPPPIDGMIARGRRARRRRTVLLAAAATAAAVVVVAGAAVLPGLRSQPQVGPAPAASSTPSESPSAGPSGGRDESSLRTALDGTWVVRALLAPGGGSVLPDSYDGEAVLTFDDGELSGTTGCNDVFGTYVQSGDRGRDLVFPRGPLGSTLVGCRDEPPLLSRLLDVRHVNGSAGVRYLQAEDGSIIAELRRP